MKEKQKHTSRYQRRGMATILHDQLIAFVIYSQSDHTGLWSWYLAEGEPGHQIYVITVCAPCDDIGVEEYTVYKQHERYIQE